jgi:tetratricopeptide (TPR) repeat protein
MMIDHLINNGIEARDEKRMLLYFLGWAEFLATGDSQNAIPYLKDSLAISKEIGFHWGVFDCFNALGQISRSTGDYENARFWCERCLDEAREHGDHWGESLALINLGWFTRELMDYHDSQLYFKESIKLAEIFDDKIMIARGQESLGYLALFLGKLNKAMAHLSQSLAITKSIGVTYRTILASAQIAISQWLTGDFKKAEAEFQESLNISKGINPALRIQVFMYYAEYLTIVGLYHQADIYLRKNDSLASNINLFLYDKARISRIRGWILLTQENFVEARNLFQQIMSIYLKTADDESIAWSKPYLALAHFRLGNRAQARDLLIEAISTEITIQAYIPMVFTLPVTLLLLVEENLEFAMNIYAQVRRDRFMGNAQLFHDLVYKHMPYELTEINVETVEHSDEHREALWETAKLVHAYLTNG